MATLGDSRRHIPLCKYSKIDNFLGTEGSSWTSATEKINLTCTLEGLNFIYQLCECLPSVLLELQIKCLYRPRATVTVAFA